MKFITDFGPYLSSLQFTIKVKQSHVAIPPLIVATIIAVAIMYFIEKIPYIPLIGGIIITLFGGLTLYFNNPVFIYMKPTIVNLIFAGMLIISKVFFQRIFSNFFKTAFNLNEVGWDKLNFRWAYFFIFLWF